MELFNTIKKVGIFIICAQMILHFKPSEQYEKYMKLLIGLMVLVQLLIPVMSFFREDGQNHFAGLLENYQQEMSVDWEDIEEDIKSGINNQIQSAEMEEEKEWGE